MNKIKLMYDIARTMRDQDNLDGNVKLSLVKDGSEVFRLDSEFSRNFASRRGKASISTVLDHEGKQFHHESSTEFNMDHDEKNETHGCKKHRLFHENHWGMHGGGLKNRLDIILTVLNALNNMKVLEQEDKSIWLSLDLNEIPEDLKEACHNCMMSRHHARAGLFEGSPVMEKGSLECRINKDCQIEDITVKLEGKLQGKNQPANDLTLDAALAFDR